MTRKMKGGCRWSMKIIKQVGASSLSALSLTLAVALGCVVALASTARAQDGSTTPPAQKGNQAQPQVTPSQEGEKAQPPKKMNERPAGSTKYAREPFDDASVQKMAGQCVRLETEAGVIEVEMLPESAPETVRNFLNLASTGAFDTTTFSRVVKGFVIQGGNLATRQTMTPELAERSGRTIADEPSSVKHTRGIVSMALPGKPNSATTHFFILVGDAPHLDGKFSAFGRVISGMDVVDSINQASTDGDKPEKPVRVTRAIVAACPVNKEDEVETQ
jgi:cyclophilin family peptidyl-prolyl cis-trans isomerase